MDQVEIQEIKQENHDWILSLLKDRWGSEIIVTRGQLHYADQLPGFIAVLDSKNVGLITYSITNNECEIITLDSLVEGKGIGTRLIERVKEMAKEKNCKRVWLITTNNNTDALKFYQKRGFVLSAIYTNAIEESRKIKPEIPAIGANNIPIRDELELEIQLVPRLGR